MSEPIPVLITGVGGRSVGHQVLQAVQLAGKRYRAVVADAAPFSYGLYAAERRYLVPPGYAPEYLDAIRRIVMREGIVAILPGTQPEVDVLSHNASSLGIGCHVIANPPEVVELGKSKEVLARWLEDNKIHTPRSVQGDDWKKLAAECGYPLVVKPTQDTGGSRGVALLADGEEVKNYLQSVAVENVLFQEYVGCIDSEFTVGVMISKEGKIIDSIVMHRVLAGLSLGIKRVIDGKTFALSTGYSQGHIRKHSQIQNACEDLALKLGARGPLNIQLRLHQGKVYVFEVHPRFSGTSSIRAQVGFNEADTLIRNFVFGEKFGRINYQTDVAAIRAFSSVIVPSKDIAAVPKA
jgi:carbamoyl-phosphate synthase large subunit